MMQAEDIEPEIWRPAEWSDYCADGFSVTLLAYGIMKREFLLCVGAWQGYIIGVFKETPVSFYKADIKVLEEGSIGYQFLCIGMFSPTELGIWFNLTELLQRFCLFRTEPAYIWLNRIWSSLWQRIKPVRILMKRVKRLFKMIAEELGIGCRERGAKIVWGVELSFADMIKTEWYDLVYARQAVEWGCYCYCCC